MPSSPPLDTEIDRLYRLPLDQFTDARNELARQTGGAAGRAVRSLGKPNAVAWALNQLYWSARPVYDRVVAATGQLREAQADTLRGRRADLRGADREHRQAVGAAVSEAARLLQTGGHAVGPDGTRALTAALEALPWMDPPGRLVRPPGPAGFAAFAGLPSPAEAPAPARQPPAPRGKSPSPLGETAGARGAREREAREKREAEAEAERQLREAVALARRNLTSTQERLRASEKRLVRAREEEELARKELERAREALGDAERDHQHAARAMADAEAASAEAEAASAATSKRR